MKRTGFIIPGLLYLLGIIVVRTVIRFLWDFAQIPEIPLESRWQGTAQGMWKTFFSRWIPITYIAFTGVALILSRLGRFYGIGTAIQGAIKRLWKWERWSYLGIPVFWLLELTWKWHGDWYFVFGIFFLGLVALKTIAILLALSSFHSEAEKSNLLNSLPANAGKAPKFYLGFTIFLLFCIIYGLTSVWQIYSISTTGDEPFYLLATHSLLNDGDLDIGNNLKNEDYRPFYQGRLIPYNLFQGRHGEVYSVYTSLLSFLLMPGYFFFGRLGATLTLNIISALMVWELWKLTLDVSRSFRPALWTSAAVGLTMPVLGLAPQVYPELTGAWLFLFGLRMLRHLSEHWLYMAGFFLSIAGLPLMKIRFAAISAGLVLASILGRTPWRRKVILIGVFGAIASILFIIDKSTGGVLLTGHIKMRVASTLNGLLNQLSWKPQSTDALLGIFFDQEFGLIWIAPFYLLALMGLPFLIRRYRWAVAVPLFISLLYIYPMVTGHYFFWWGGWSMPARYWAFLLPVLGMWAILTLHQTKSSVIRSIAAGSIIWSVLISFTIVLFPMLRYNNADGTNRIADILEEWVRIPFARIIPSLINPIPEGNIALWIILSVLCLGAIMFLCIKRNPKDSEIKKYDDPWMSKKTSGLGLLFLITTMGILLFMGASIPTTVLEGEAMRATTGIHFNQHINVWVMKESGSLSSEAVLTGGDTHFDVDAASFTTVSDGPIIELWVDGLKLGDCHLPVTDGVWKKHTCRYFRRILRTGNPGPGKKLLELRFINGLNHIRTNQIRQIYVDKIHIYL